MVSKAVVRSEVCQLVAEMPFGFAVLRATDSELVSIDLQQEAPADSLQQGVSTVLIEASRQIDRYLRDPGFRFTMPLRMTGTAYQRRVWTSLCAIPVSSVKTYGQLAYELASGPRAIAMACRANEFPIIVPCHRIVAVNGLGGYAGKRNGFNIAVKRWLLEHEGVTLE